jgi:hypothetical protein
MGKRRQVNYTPQKTNSMEDLVGNGHSVPDPTK